MKIQHIIETTKTALGKDLSVYSASFLKKAVARRMSETSLWNFGDYSDHLTASSDELGKLIDSLSVTYTIFFRNPIDVALLEEIVFPGLFKVKRALTSNPVRIWSAGCAGGPETYTLAMIADMAASKRSVSIPVLAFGTDMSREAIEAAKRGTYDRETVLHVKLSYLDGYFVQKKSQFTVIDGIRSMVDFSLGDIVDPAYSSPPGGIFADFDIVSCCNLLIYYNHDMQRQILDKLYHAIVQNGYLLVGESERMIVEKYGKFSQLSAFGNIFIKN